MSCYLAPLRRQNAPNSLKHQLEVCPGTALINVEQVKVDPLVEANGITVLPRLPVTRDSRLHEKALALVRGVEICLAPQGGTRTHDAHVPE